MSKEVSKTKVGAFVLGSIFLLIAGIFLLGGRSFFTEEIDYVLYFDGSVSGLAIGAPVVFRGVPLGKVTQILLVADGQAEGVTIPVYIEVSADSIVSLNSTDKMTVGERTNLMRRMIQRGLRARLQLQSLITGQYRVELDFFPETPARYHSTDHAHEIPTVPSPLDEIQRTLAKLPIEAMAQSFNAALNGIAQLTTNKDLYAALAAVRLTFENTAELTAGAQAMRDDLQRMLNAIGDTSATLDAQLPEAMAAFQLAMTSFAALAKELEEVVASAEAIVDPNSRTLRELHSTMGEIAHAARSFRELADMLERQPESLLLGKGAR